MKKMMILLLLALAVQWAVAQQADTAWRGIDNTFLYERYAPRQDLVVAQIVHYPIGDSMFVNMVMLQALDSESFLRLLKEFGLAHPEVHLRFNDKHANISHFADMYDPTKKAPLLPKGIVDYSKACSVFVYPGYLTLWIAHFRTEAESHRLTHLSTKHIHDGTQF